MLSLQVIVSSIASIILLGEEASMNKKYFWISMLGILLLASSVALACPLHEGQGASKDKDVEEVVETASTDLAVGD